MKYQFEHFKSADYIKKEAGVDFSFPAHLHQSFELIIIRSGSMTVEVDSKKYELSKNEAVLIFPNQVHSLFSVKSEHTLFIFSPFIIQAYSSRLYGCVPEDGKFVLSKNTMEMLDELDDDSPSRSTKKVPMRLPLRAIAVAACLFIAMFLGWYQYQQYNISSVRIAGEDIETDASVVMQKQMAEMFNSLDLNDR